MVPKITLDGGLLRDAALLPSVKMLVDWESQGKLELFESDRAKTPPANVPTAYTWPGAVSAVKRRNGGRNVARTEPGGISFQRLSAVLFPQRDPTRLNMTQVNDVAHLLRHHVLGHSMFVTVNERDFMDLGRRERLRDAFRIVVLTPDEAVNALKASGTFEIGSEAKVARRGAK